MIRKLQSDDKGSILEGVFDSTSLFLGAMRVVINEDEGATKEYAEECIEHYNRLDDNQDLMDEIQRRLVKFFLYMYEEWKEMELTDDDKLKQDLDEVMEGYKDGKSLLDYLTDPTLLITAPQDERIGYSIVCECPWEPEHKCQMIILEDELLYVGPEEELNAWCDEDDFYCEWDDGE